MMVSLTALVLGLLFQVSIGSLIGAIILRAACALFNKWFGKEFIPATDQFETQPVTRPPVNPASQSPESQSPYAPPMAPLMQSDGGVYARGVAQPNFGRAFLICLVASIANILLGILLGSMIGLATHGPEAPAFPVQLILIQVALFICSFVIMTIAISVGLPTSFPRAMGVTGLFLLIALAVGIAIALVVVVVMTIASNT